MPGEEFLSYTIEQLAPLLQRRQLSPVEVTEACLKRIEMLNGKVSAYLSVLVEQALEQARSAENALVRGEARSPLHGVPVSVKDVFETKGIPTTWGAKALEHYVSSEDSTVVVKLREAGAILLGKTNVDTSPYDGGLEGPRLIGPTHNPWDLERTAGRSSGGSAASVAALLGYASVGTDAGGSIRIPAAYCGVVGLMPTFGLVSRYRIFRYSDSFDHCGPLARSVHDCALVLGAIVGYDPRDSTTLHCDMPRFTRKLGESVRGLRVGISRTAIWEDNDPEVIRLVDRAVATLAKLGMQMQEINLPYLQMTHWTTIVNILEMTAKFEAMAPPKRPPDHYAAYLLTWAAARRNWLLNWGIQISRAVRRRYREIFHQVDLIVIPTVPISAPRFDEDNVPWQRPEETLPELELRYTRLFNLIKFPTISIPCGFASNGMPVGFQIVGRPFEEELLLQAAHSYERAAGWYLHNPGIA